MQKEIFLREEGNAWFRRNADKSTPPQTLHNYLILLSLWSRLPSQPQCVLEIGCSSGKKLALLQQHYGNARYFGIDPSSEAIAKGKTAYPSIALTQGTADHLPYPDKSFDTIIFGHCLYLCDREDLFKIACEADRCLQEKGFLVIIDFSSDRVYKNIYKHKEGIFSYKMNYANMFLWNPRYSLAEMLSFSHTDSTFSEIEDERISLQMLFKNPCETVWPL